MLGGLRVPGKSMLQKPGFWVSAAGLAALTAAFLCWYGDGGVSAAGLIAALCSAGAFAAVCLRFVPVWMNFWRTDSALPAAPAEDGTPRHITFRIFTAFLAVDILVLLAVFGLRRCFGYSESFAQSLTFWRCLDSNQYLDIAENWYTAGGDMDRMVSLVFLPGYPIAVWLLHWLTGEYLYAALLVSALCFAGAGCVLYRLFRLDVGHGDAVRALVFLCLLPGGFFFAAPMSESLFLLLCAACLYCARTGKWALGCLFGGLAAFTRSLGLTLLVPLVFELLHDAALRRGGRPLRWAALLLVPAGFGVYCWINYCVSGNPFQYLIYQKEHWGQQLGWFFNTAAYQTDYALACAATDVHTLLGLWLPNLFCAFAALAVLLQAVKKLRPSYTAWSLAYYVIAIGATWLLSGPRYLAALIPLPLAVSALTRKRLPAYLLTAGCAALYGLYLCAFVLRWQVW